MRVSPGSSVLLVFLLAPFCFSQLPSSRCDSTEGALKTCIYLPQIDTTPERALKPDAHAVEVRALQATDGKSDSGQTTMAAEPSRNDSFHWRRALTESFTFLVIEQAYVVHTDFKVHRLPPTPVKSILHAECVSLAVSPGTAVC